MSICGAGAFTEFVEPTITVRSTGAAPLIGPTPTCNPLGSVSNVNVVVFGYRKTLFVSVKPLPSVAVSCSSRNVG